MDIPGAGCCAAADGLWVLRYRVGLDRVTFDDLRLVEDYALTILF